MKHEGTSPSKLNTLTSYDASSWENNSVAMQLVPIYH
jgi:hypothetical protein